MNFTKFPKSLVAARGEKARGGCRRSCNPSSTPSGKDGEDLSEYPRQERMHLPLNYLNLVCRGLGFVSAGG